ncbi:MAG: YkgJ family cysteine cluster protein [Candidatus Micrarchaeota archaeon]|nr:YkgJ family cysteine cluster protein [Candidatus Micrarchaeota archaeon]
MSLYDLVTGKYFGPCTFCDARCCKEYTITITAHDFSNIVKNLKLKRSDLDKYFELLKASLLNSDEATIILIKDDAESIHECLLTLKSHPCIFLKNNKCGIHKFAPLVCKLYPFRYNGQMLSSARCVLISKVGYFLENKSNKKNIMKIADQFSYNLYEYRKLIRQWNTSPGSKEQFFDYLYSLTNE